MEEYSRTISAYDDSTIRFEDYIKPDTAGAIISSKSFRNGQWRNISKAASDRDGVSKCVVPIDMSSFSLKVETTVAPGTTVARHSHQEGSVVRFITSGSLILNGVKYSAGDWIFVPKGVAYEIETEEGYTALVDYDGCKTCQ